MFLVFPVIGLLALPLLFGDTLYCFKKELGLANDRFKKYVVCFRCHSLYTFEECYHRVGTYNT